MKTILIVDDHAHIVKLIEFSLEEIDCRVETAHTGEEALSKAAKMQIDLIITDVKLPGVDGFETVRRIRQNENCARLPVIIMTGQGQSEVQKQASGIDFAEFLTKPFSPTDLVHKAPSLLAL